MTTNLISPDPMPPDEQQQADQIDQWITQRQQGAPMADPRTAPPAETMLVDALVQMAATTAPSPAFVAALAEHLRKEQAAQQRSTSQRFLFPIRRLAIAATLLLALGSALYLTPAARATLWDWLYGFGLIVEEQVAEAPIPLTTPVMPVTAPTPLTLSALQEQAPFAFHPPTWLPIGLRYTGGFVMPGADGTIVTLAYHMTDTPVGGYPLDAPLLFVIISDGAIPNRPLVAEGYQQQVRIGNHTGVYTHGNWRSTAEGTTATPTTTLVWDSTLDAAWLTWQMDGLNYLLYAQELQADAEDLVMVAVSMQ